MRHLRSALIAGTVALLALLVVGQRVRSVGTFIVNSTGDADDFSVDGTCETATSNGICTLRAAITEANADPGSSVTFAIAGGGAHTITLGTPVTITGDGTVVDGTSQSGATCGDLWTSSAPAWTIIVQAPADNCGIELDGDNAILKGLDVTGAVSSSGSCANIIIRAAGATVQCSRARDAGTNGHGIEIDSLASAVTIGGGNAGDGNVMKDNAQSGLFVFGSDHIIKGNFIGVDEDGTTAAANDAGLIVDATAADITIGGAGLREKNLVSGNTSDGLAYNGTGGTITNNYVGVDITQARTLCNSFVPGSATSSGNITCFGCCVITGATGACETALEGLLTSVSGGLCADAGNVGNQTEAACNGVPGFVTGGAVADCTGAMGITVARWVHLQACADGCTPARNRYHSVVFN